MSSNSVVVDKLEYEVLENGGCRVVGCQGGGKFVIPSFIPFGGKQIPVTEVSKMWNEEIQSLTIGSNVKIIGDSCFEGAWLLKEVLFAPNSCLATIEKDAFRTMGIEKIRIPAGVEKIGDNAFFGSPDLREVLFLPNSRLQEIGEGAFDGTNLPSLTIPKSCSRLDGSLWCDVKSVVLAGNEHFVLREGFVLSADGKVAVRSFREEEKVVLPDVEVIGPCAFGDAIAERNKF